MTRVLRARTALFLTFTFLSLTFLTCTLSLAAPARADDATATDAPATAPETPAAQPAATLVESKRPMRIAVYDLDSPGIEPRVARLFVDSLLAELRKLQRASVVSLDEVRALLSLEAKKQMVGCTDSSCLAEIAEALGADVLIVGGFANVAGSVALSLKRIDARKAEVVADYTQQLADAGGEELLAAVGPAVTKLFSDTPLREGESRGVAPEVALRLHPPPIPLWAFVTSAGVSGATLIATSLSALWFATAVGDLQRSFTAAKTSPVPAAQVREQQANVQNANVVLWCAVGASAASLIVTGVLVPFTDWNGVADRGAE